MSSSGPKAMQTFEEKKDLSDSGNSLEELGGIPLWKNEEGGRFPSRLALKGDVWHFSKPRRVRREGLSKEKKGNISDVVLVRRKELLR